MQRLLRFGVLATAIALSIIGSGAIASARTSHGGPGGHVYVANAGAGGSNYTGFTLSGGGRLQPIAGSTFALPDIANPGDVLFNGDGSYFVGVRVGPNAGPSFIDTFLVGTDGLLTPAAGSPFASQVTGPFGSVFSPNDPSQLFVTNAHGGPGAGSVSVFDLTNGVPAAIP